MNDELCRILILLCRQAFLANYLTFTLIEYTHCIWFQVWYNFLKMKLFDPEWWLILQVA